ncbi:MAG TPA: hypothetical protein DEA75_15950 [Rhodobacteraceae bacterium]|nr:hypothetical protein [Paracoccaceae bacterium]
MDSVFRNNEVSHCLNVERKGNRANAKCAPQTKPTTVFNPPAGANFQIASPAGTGSCISISAKT